MGKTNLIIAPYW